MRRIMLIVAYDGTNYKGWQIQKNGETIESVLNRELSRLLKEDIKVIGASRTDSGVHAEGAVCVFDTVSMIPGDKFSFALNQSLPEDIKVMASKEVRASFHPRKTDCLKTYRYSIYNDTFQLPSKRFNTHWVHGELDTEAMSRAAAFLVGEHDFKAFSSQGSSAKTTVRRIERISVEKTGRQIDIFITGNGFLYNMVRIIAGTLIEIGQGKYPPENMMEVLSAGKRERAGQTAPARGLTLVGYEFFDL